MKVFFKTYLMAMLVFLLVKDHLNCCRLKKEEEEMKEREQRNRTKKTLWLEREKKISRQERERSREESALTGK